MPLIILRATSCREPTEKDYYRPKDHKRRNELAQAGDTNTRNNPKNNIQAQTNI